ncbi:MAG: hypothetical protein KDB33_08325 [Acidimicrobiales bacterium]|nr:hypothetical protein [Acidimicrobiales bacterium]
MTAARLRRLLPDVLALTAIMAVALAFVGTSSLFSSDEGAALAQANVLDATGGWLVAHPFPEIDPDGRWFAFYRPDGGPAQFAPYAKHPSYPLLLQPLVAAGGMGGALVASVLGTVIAAVAAAWLAGSLRQGAERAALWIVGLGSPLFFDAGLVMAHSLGAAGCGLAACAFVGYRRSPRPVVLALGLAATVAAILVRSEALFFGLAAGAVLAGWGLRRRAWREVAAGAAVAVASVVTLLVERRWVASIIDGSLVVPTAGLARGDLVAGRISGALWTFVSTTGRGSGLVAGAALLAMLAAVVAGFAMRARPPSRVAAVGASVVVAVAAVVAAVAPEPDAISGLLATCPFLVVGLLLLRRSDLTDPTSGFLLAVSALVALAVVATQYDIGGAAEWGGRFMAIVLPLLLAVAVPVVLRRTTAVGPAIGRPVLACLVVATAALSVLSMRTLATFHDRSASLADAWRLAVEAESADGGGPPVVVTTSPALGRLTWDAVGDARQLLVEPAEVPAAVEALDGLGVDRLVLVLDGPATGEELPTGWTVVASGPIGPWGGQVLVVEAD